MDAAAIEEAIDRLESSSHSLDEGEDFSLDPPDAPSEDEHTRRGALMAAREIELIHRQRSVEAVRRPEHIDLVPPGIVDADSGRPQLSPEPTLVLLGRYLRRARMLAGKTQQRVADETGVSQSMVSRAERGVAPGMPIERLVVMSAAFDRLFPFGICPHDHECAWQPVKRDLVDPVDASKFIEYLMRVAGEH